MKIDHEEAMRRANTLHLAIKNLAAYVKNESYAINQMAAAIEQAVKETTEECAQLCERNADQYASTSPIWALAERPISAALRRQASQIRAAFGGLPLRSRGRKATTRGETA